MGEEGGAVPSEDQGECSDIGWKGPCVYLHCCPSWPTGLRSTGHQRGIIAKTRIAVLSTGNPRLAGQSAALSPTKTGRAREEYAMCN